MKTLIVTGASLMLSAFLMIAQEPAPAAAPAAKQRAKRPPRPGIPTPGVRREMTSIKPIAVFPVEGTPDWQAVASYVSENLRWKLFLSARGRI
jgi:hypothetical protein